MVHVFSVTKLMHHYTVQDFAGCKHEQAVEVEVAFSGTAPPYGLLVSDGDPAVRHADERSVVPDALGDDLRRALCRFLPLDLGKIDRCFMRAARERLGLRGRDRRFAAQMLHERGKILDRIDRRAADVRRLRRVVLRHEERGIALVVRVDQHRQNAGDRAHGAVKRKLADWPETKEAAEEHWRKRLKYEMLAVTVNRELDAEEAAKKDAEKKAEDARVVVRNYRRDAIESLKKQEKASEITEDDLKNLTKDVQDITDSYVKKVDEVYKTKEKEVLED